MVSAVIFDLDGTVLDNEGIWEEVFRQMVVDHSLTQIKTVGKKWIHEPGIGIAPNWQMLITGPAEVVGKLSRQTWQKYWRMVGGAANLPLRDGLVELVEEIKSRGWQTALATGSEWHIVEEELEQLDLYLAFDITTTGEEILAFKPDPEIYLLSAQKLGVDPKECAVVEDSLAGVRAAADCGMWPVGIISDYASQKQLLASGAKLTVANLSEVMVGLDAYASQGEKNN